MRTPELSEKTYTTKFDKPHISKDSLTEQQHDKLWAHFNDAIRPIFNQKKLGCVVFQYGDGFGPSDENKTYIRWCRQHLFAECPMVIEFRNRSWLDPSCLQDTLKFLKALKICLTAVDELESERFHMPDLASSSYKVLPVLLYPTHPDMVYIRLHRRVGTEKRLHDSEIQDWTNRLMRLVFNDWKSESKKRTIFFMWNANYQNHGFINHSKLRSSLQQALQQSSNPSLVNLIPWKEMVKEHQMKSGIGAFFQTKPDKMDKSAASNEDKKEEESEVKIISTSTQPPAEPNKKRKSNSESPSKKTKLDPKQPTLFDFIKK